MKDYREHPEWFTVKSLDPSPAHLALLSCENLNSCHRDEIISRITNPPVMITRKPIPFVLPIRGSAL
jgi:hypothetical protein